MEELKKTQIKIQIRNKIQENGKELYKYLSNNNSKYIAGEFMKLNENWALDNYDSYGYYDICETGFTKNQKIWLIRLNRELFANSVKDEVNEE